MPARARTSAAVAALTLVIAFGALPAASAVAAPARAPATTAAAAPGDRLAAGSSLAAGASLRSPGGVATLTLQTDGNLVEYAGGRAVWTTSTRGSGATRLTLQTDGNLVLYTAAGAAVWGSFTYSSAPAFLLVRDDGSVQTTSTSGAGYWGIQPRLDLLASGGAIGPGQTLYSPDQQYRLILQTDGNLVLYSATNVPVWYTATASPMRSLTMQTDGNLVLRDTSGRAVWATWTQGTAGAVLSVTTAVSATVGVAPAVAWRSPVPGGRVWRNQVLASGATLTGSTGRLVMQTDGNLVRRDSAGAAAWATYTSSPGAYLSMQGDGNLVVRSKAGAALWWTGTQATTATYVQLSAAGFVYLGDAGRPPVWVEGPPNWTALARCESGGNPRAVNPAGYYGLYQFDLTTWRSNGGTGNPIDASPSVQTAVAATLYLARGRQPWPTCGRYL